MIPHAIYIGYVVYFLQTLLLPSCEAKLPPASCGHACNMWCPPQEPAAAEGCIRYLSFAQLMASQMPGPKWEAADDISGSYQLLSNRGTGSNFDNVLAVIQWVR